MGLCLGKKKSTSVIGKTGGMVATNLRSNQHHVRSLSQDSDAASNFSTHVYPPTILYPSTIFNEREHKFIREPEDDSDCEWLPSPPCYPKL